MGQKIHPTSFRLGVTKGWAARWFFIRAIGETFKGAKQGGSSKYLYARFLRDDEAIRRVVQERIGQAGIAAIEIERTSNALRVLIRAARPGLVIGRGGKGIEELTKAIEATLAKMRDEKMRGPRLGLTVEELKRSDISAVYVAQQISWDLERRLPYRRTIKKYLDQIMQNRDVKGAKITISGRLGGAEIARRETVKNGVLPLQMLRADIDYGSATAFLTYGTIGVKVWIYKGEVFQKETNSRE